MPAVTIRTIATAVIAAVAAVFLLVNGIAAGLARSGSYAAAVDWRPNADRLARAADAAFLAKRYAEALQLARRSIAISPIEPRALRVYGLSQIALGRPDQGIVMMNVAARTGWRDTLTQTWVLQAALTDGDFETALQRADALIRRRVSPDLVFTAIRALLVAPEMRSLLRTRLEDQPDWRELLFLSLRGTKREELNGALAFVDELARTRLKARDTEIYALVERLIEWNDNATAMRVWQPTAPAAGVVRNNLLFDGGFAVADTRQGKLLNIPRFEWTIDTSTAWASIQIAPDGSGPALQLNGDGISQIELAKQTRVLPTGRYRLSARLFGEDGLTASGYLFKVRCAPGGAEPKLSTEEYRPHRMNQAMIAFTFDIPAEGCERQEIVLLNRAGRGVMPKTVWIDDVTLAAVP